MGRQSLNLRRVRARNRAKAKYPSYELWFSAKKKDIRELVPAPWANADLPFRDLKKQIFGNN